MPITRRISLKIDSLDFDIACGGQSRTIILHTVTMTAEFRPPGFYNAAADLLDRNSKNAGKIAFVDDRGSYTYQELAERVHRCANALRNLTLERGNRVALCLLDTIDFPT